MTLRSVIWRRRNNPAPGERRTQSAVYEYERPGGAALSELAPLSRFYAGGRQVEIDQIDLSLSPVETWRFCPRCTHAEDIGTGDANAACPSCGGPHWGDLGQVQQLVRLRQVLATAEDARSRIGDEAEDREPTFYTRQLLPDFLLRDVELAYRLASDALPFGFEFIRRIKFREMNFGKYAEAGEISVIAGRESARPGFRLCRHCGKVQRPRWNPRTQAANQHTFNCPSREREDAEAFVDCLYLYREFESEALRILLPFTEVASDERLLDSFVAALQLGLRLKFRGRVDHLRMTDYAEPDPETGAQCRYLLLYDSVPGGTGYLHELLREEGQLLDVFALARDHMVACLCNHDPDKDGCYECLYAYRLSHGMESTSRRTAVELLSRILDAKERLERVPTLRGTKVERPLDSVLEARFIEALRRIGIQVEDVRVHPDIVRGKPGYFLSVGANDYLIEPQVTLGPSEGVAVPCRPDFVIWPAREGKTGRPIALFTDGFSYHKDCVTDDTLKRLALVQSGRFWVWNITWQDVETVLSSRPDDVGSLLRTDQVLSVAGLADRMREALGVADLRAAVTLPPLPQLIAWLRSPDKVRWRAAVFTEAFGWFDPNKNSDPLWTEAARSRLAERAPGPLSELVGCETEALHAEIQAASAQPLQVLCSLPKLALTPPAPDRLVTLLWLNPGGMTDEIAYKNHWRRFLAAINVVQFLPRAAWVTEEGLRRGAYEALAWRGLSTAEEISMEIEIDLSWQAVLAEAVEEVAEGLRELMARRVGVPQVGFEIQDDAGAVVAEAELAWPGPHLAVLRSDQEDGEAPFTARGWRVVTANPGWETQALTVLLEGEAR